MKSNLSMGSSTVGNIASAGKSVWALLILSTYAIGRDVLVGLERPSSGGAASAPNMPDF